MVSSLPISTPTFHVTAPSNTENETMPNHITNVLRISAYEHLGAPPDLIDKILDAIKGNHGEGETLAIDFERIIPMPPTLKLTSGSVSSNAIALFSDSDARGMLSWPWVREAGVRDLDGLRQLLREQYLQRPSDGFATLDDFAKQVIENHEKHGAPTWYEWSVKHWGTKWNAYSITGGRTQSYEAVIHFETAWSPPMPVLDKLAEMFPKAHLRLIWVDEGSDKAHRDYWENGKRCVEEDL